MFVIIDKASSEFYKQNVFISRENKNDVVLFTTWARKFRSKENAEKFLKRFTDKSNYEIVEVN